MRRLLCLLSVALVGVFGLCLAAGDAQANVGVGIMPGSIRVDEPLMPGGIYNLPSVQTVNTGTEASNYEVKLVYMEQQDELVPPEEFIVLSPISFHLEPGATQVVSLSLSIPVKAKPGDYLAYIEAHPVAEGSGMSIGVAAATKLYFTIKPANVLVGIANSIGNFFSRTSPASYIVLGVVIAGIAVYFLRKRIKIDIRVGRRDTR
ncbi:hypothetical protein ACFLTL_00290 [Chloroflexota bacterium]